MSAEYEDSSYVRALGTVTFKKARISKRAAGFMNKPGIPQCFINRLPTELLLQIFHFARESATLLIPPRPNSCLWALRRVCTRWRQIALKDFDGVFITITPYSREDMLTSRLRETLQHAREALQSGPNRLSLKFRTDECSIRLRDSVLPITELIAPCIVRIAHLSLTLAWPALRALCALPPGALAVMETFAVHFLAMPKQQDRQAFLETRIFEGAKRLRSLRVGHHGPTHYLAQFPSCIPWHQLLQVVFDSPEGTMLDGTAALRILRECHKVVECLIKIRPSQKDDSASFEKVTVPRLRLLNLAVSPSRHRNVFLDCLELPRLKVLCVAFSDVKINPAGPQHLEVDLGPSTASPSSWFTGDMIIEKQPLPDDPTPSDSPPSYETANSQPSHTQFRNEKQPEPIGSTSTTRTTHTLSSPALSPNPIPIATSPSSSSSKGKGRANNSWFNFSASRTTREIHTTVRGLVRDLVREQSRNSAASLAILESCAEACSGYDLALSAILQEKSIEGHTPMYWAIVKRPPDGEEDGTAVPDLLTALISYANPLDPKTISDIRHACLLTSDQALFQRLRMSPEFSPLSGTDEMLLGATIPPDEITVENVTGDEGSFAVNLKIVHFQKRMLVSKRIELDFIARSASSTATARDRD
ncbi:hypothetical protein DXG01_006856 [Tephrocybe rancida]|nr:hypothetical protein DXG01_006856 [Tephrocybe rancida]